jgi:hypothetical protein
MVAPCSKVGYSETEIRRMSEIHTAARRKIDIRRLPRLKLMKDKDLHRYGIEHKAEERERTRDRVAGT